MRAHTGVEPLLEPLQPVPLVLEPVLTLPLIVVPLLLEPLPPVPLVLTLPLAPLPIKLPLFAPLAAPLLSIPLEPLLDAPLPAAPLLPPLDPSGPPAAMPPHARTGAVIDKRTARCSARAIREVLMVPTNAMGMPLRFAAFLRRCVCHRVPQQGKAAMVRGTPAFL